MWWLQVLNKLKGMIRLIHINSHREQTLNSLIYRFCLITLKVVFDAILNSISSRSSRRDRKQTSVRQYEQGAVRTFLHSYIWTWSQAFSRLIGWNVSIAEVRCDHGFHIRSSFKHKQNLQRSGNVSPVFHSKISSKVAFLLRTEDSQRLTRDSAALHHGHCDI